MAFREAFGFQDHAFQVQYAAFINFVGGEEISNAVKRVEGKQRQSGEAGVLFGERYFLHDQIAKIADNNFQLDVNDFFAVRAASLMAAVNHVKGQLSAKGSEKLKRSIIGNMRPDRDIRQVEHELRCFTHIKQLGHKVDFSDIEDSGNGKKFDLIVEATGKDIEVECKTIKYDAGSQIKEQLSVSLTNAFQGHVLKHMGTAGSGLFVFQLKRPSAECKNLDVRLREILRLSADLPYNCDDFSLTSIPKPDWQADWDAKRFEQLRQKLKTEFGDESHCSLDGGNRIVGASFLPHAPSALADHTVEVIHEASRQCTGTRPCVVWIHFIGLSQSDFMEIINASKDGGALNAVASMGIFDDRGPEGRDHVERIRFTADSDQLVSHTVRGPDGSPVNAVSVAGFTYDVLNPKCRYPAIERI